MSRTQTVTYLEMTTPTQLSPAAPVPGLVLEAAEDIPVLRSTLMRIGTPYHWSDIDWADERWARWLADPAHQAMLIRYETEVAGLARYETQPANTVEIVTFGLVPEYVGRGLGGYSLTLVVRHAWQAASVVRRVWLHTSSLDNPGALPNYRKRGFRPFRTEIRGASDQPPLA